MIEKERKKGHEAKKLSQITPCYLGFAFMSVNIYGSSISFSIHTKNRDAPHFYAPADKQKTLQKFKQ